MSELYTGNKCTPYTHQRDHPCLPVLFLIKIHVQQCIISLICTIKPKFNFAIRENL